MLRRKENDVNSEARKMLQKLQLFPPALYLEEGIHENLVRTLCSSASYPASPARYGGLWRVVPSDAGIYKYLLPNGIKKHRLISQTVLSCTDFQVTAKSLLLKGGAPVRKSDSRWRLRRLTDVTYPEGYWGGGLCFAKRNVRSRQKLHKLISSKFPTANL